MSSGNRALSREANLTVPGIQFSVSRDDTGHMTTTASATAGIGDAAQALRDAIKHHLYEAEMWGEYGVPDEGDECTPDEMERRHRADANRCHRALIDLIGKAEADEHVAACGRYVNRRVHGD